jgi:hypothetical protein
MKALTAIAGLAGKLLGTVGGFFGLNRAWLTLLLVASIGAGFYVMWARTNARLEARVAWIDVACASAGTAWAPVEGSKLKPGQQCQAEIASLAHFRADTTRVTAETLAAASTARDDKLIADTNATRAAAIAARDAAQSMEDANAALKDDRVSGAWWDAFNHAAGLPAPKH